MSSSAQVPPQKPPAASEKSMGRRRRLRSICTLRFFLEGMQGVISLSIKALRNQSASYPRSASKTFARGMAARALPHRCSRWYFPRSDTSGRAAPGCHKPRGVSSFCPLSSARSACWTRFFPQAGGGAVGLEVCGVNHDHRRFGILIDQFQQDARKYPLLAPTIPVIVKRLVRAIDRRRISPAQPIANDKYYPAQHPFVRKMIPRIIF